MQQPAITRLVIIVVHQPYCQRCGTVLGYNIAVIEGQPAPELLCRKCHRPRRILPDGAGIPFGEGVEATCG
jgi:hypothetical protein